MLGILFSWVKSRRRGAVVNLRGRPVSEATSSANPIESMTVDSVVSCFRWELFATHVALRRDVASIYLRICTASPACVVWDLYLLMT